jgi:hypothetical protein
MPSPVIRPVPVDWRGKTLTLEIKAVNLTHYAFSAGPADSKSRMETIAYGRGQMLSWGFTGEFGRPICVAWTLNETSLMICAGALIGTYSTNNAGGGTTKAYISKWTYAAHEQFRD